MCGRMNVTDHPGVQDLLDELGIGYPVTPQLNIAPGGQTSFVIDTGEDRDLVDGYWSLLIEKKTNNKNGYRPNPKYKTFNAQSRRLKDSRLWSSAFQSSRCVVPVSGFHEWRDGRCYNISPADGSAFALGGLYRLNRFDQDIIPSFTVITLPPQEKFFHIHDKSFPFILKEKEFDSWLDPNQVDVGIFDHLLEQGMPVPIRVSEIRDPSSLEELHIEVIE